MRTGFTEAWRSDASDASYDLSWVSRLPEADRPAIAELRNLLADDPDPIDRHFQFAELETRLYRSRDLYSTALEEFDRACQLHDAEMDVICAAFLAKWNQVPLLETYRQMAIRQQKKQDWKACIWWAERGLALYGSSAAREEAVQDLVKRRNRAQARLDTSTRPTDTEISGQFGAASLSGQSYSSAQSLANTTPGTEVLVCARCDTAFERVRVRGRKPLLCPTCRSVRNEPDSPAGRR